MTTRQSEPLVKSHVPPVPTVPVRVTVREGSTVTDEVVELAGVPQVGDRIYNVCDRSLVLAELVNWHPVTDRSTVVASVLAR
jgi:hypothetical protein